MQFNKHIPEEFIMEFFMDLFEYLMYWVERIAPYFICFWVGFALSELIRL